MPFLSCCQTFGRAFVRLPHTAAADGGDARPSLGGFATGDIMSSMLHVIAILAMMVVLRVPLLAQENSVEIPARTSQPQPQVQPPPPYPPALAGEGREGAGNPRFAFHRIDGGFLRLDLRTGAVPSRHPNAAAWTRVPRRGARGARGR